MKIKIKCSVCMKDLPMVSYYATGSDKDGEPAFVAVIRPTCVCQDKADIPAALKKMRDAVVKEADKWTS